MVSASIAAHGIAMLLLGVLLGCGGSPAGDRCGDGEPPPGTTPPGRAAGRRHSPRPTARASASRRWRPGCRFPGASRSRPTAGCSSASGRAACASIRTARCCAEPALTLTDVFTRDESGILGLAVHPDFATNRLVYLTYTANGPRGPIARLMRFREVDNRLAEGVVLLDDVPAANIHNGSRVRFGPDGRLYVTFGDVADAVDRAGRRVAQRQDPAPERRRHQRRPATASARPVFSFGHRNPQGIDWHPVTGDLWETEHGQTNNDEINVIDSGVNYGWPIIEADRDAARHGDAGHVLRAGRRAVGRLVLSRHRDPGVPESAVRRDAAGDGAAAR